MDKVFEALSHPTRRALLDHLRAADGATTGALEAGQGSSRFAVMKHLKILEDAGLVTSRKVGRERRHYLNPVPIQEIADRWIARFSAPLLQHLTLLKAIAETPTMTATPTSPAPVHVWEMFVRATPEAFWAVLTDDARTPLWQHFDMSHRTEWRVGGRIALLLGDKEMIVGELLELDPPRRLVHSFSARWAPDVAADAPSRVTWEITPVGEGACKVVLTHDGFEGLTATARAVTGGWPEALSRLKTLVETDTRFRMPAQNVA